MPSSRRGETLPVAINAANICRGRCLHRPADGPRHIIRRLRWGMLPPDRCFRPAGMKAKPPSPKLTAGRWRWKAAIPSAGGATPFCWAGCRKRWPKPWGRMCSPRRNWSCCTSRWITWALTSTMPARPSSRAASIPPTPGRAARALRWNGPSRRTASIGPSAF
jgi:hypothetical protein